MEPGVSFSDQLGGKAPDSITGNPAAENELPGTGLAGRLLHLPEDSGLRLGGLWLVDTNGLISGGAQPGKWSWNSALVIGANFDAEKLLDWKGASFGIQFLQFNGQNTSTIRSSSGSGRRFPLTISTTWRGPFPPRTRL